MGYIRDLITRMNSSEELPQKGPTKTSEDTVSWQAFREAEKTIEVGHLVEMEEISRKSKKWEDVTDLAFICSWMIRNTGDARARELYLSLRHEGASTHAMMNLIDGATRAGLKEYEGVVRDMMFRDVKRGNCHFSSAIKYLSKVVGVSALHDIGKALDNDCWGRCEPFYCCIELGELGSKDAVPYLERAIERHRKGRKGWQKDAVDFAKIALRELGVESS